MNNNHIYKVCLTVEDERGIFNINMSARNEEEAGKRAIKLLETNYPIYRGRATVYNCRKVL